MQAGRKSSANFANGVRAAPTTAPTTSLLSQSARRRRGYCFFAWDSPRSPKNCKSSSARDTLFRGSIVSPQKPRARLTPPSVRLLTHTPKNATPITAKHCARVTVKISMMDPCKMAAVQTLTAATRIAYSAKKRICRIRRHWGRVRSEKRILDPFLQVKRMGKIKRLIFIIFATIRNVIGKSVLRPFLTQPAFRL